MANRGDVNRLCSNLTKMGVDIKPEELQNLSRAIAFRVMTDFTVAALLAAPESLNQQLAISLENCNPNSAAVPLIQNKTILWSEAFVLLSKGGFTFEIADLIRPEPKKFNQLLQQMLKYLFYSAKIYDAVGDGCSSLEEAAEEIEKERVVFELDKEKLRICEQKIQHLNEARIAEELDRAIVQRDEVLQEAKRLQTEYSELKATWEKEQAELFVAEELLSTCEQRLLELRDLVVSDPDSYVSALEQLRKDSVAKAALLAAKEKQLNEVNGEHKLLEDLSQRVQKLLGVAKGIGTALEEFHENTETMEKKIEENHKSIADMQSERDRMRKDVESRNEKLKAMNEHERSKFETIQGLEKEDALKQKVLADTARQKAPLASELTRTKQELSDIISWTEESEESDQLDRRQKYEELSERWKSHIEGVRSFEAECLKTEKRLKLSHSKLQNLAEALGSLDVDAD